MTAAAVYAASSTTLVPFKVIFESLNYKITYDAKAKTIKAVKDDTTLSLTVGSTNAYVNGKETKLPVAPKIVNGVTYVPLRFIANASGENVTFDNSWRAIQIGDQIDWKKLGNPSFRNAKWGMTKAQVKKTENSVLIEDNTTDPSQYLSYQAKISGYDALAAYFLPDNAFSAAAYFVEPSGASTHVEDFKTLRAYLTSLYGPPVKDFMALYQEQGYDYSDEIWEQLMLAGQWDGFVASWHSVDAEISLIVTPPNTLDITDIQINYSSWNAHVE
ncbi:copper amine oxidase N-terminal domain-containing protein [Cohnella sp. GCM10012308]|uniref:copper amine oxidase N-terminal domain-containing protein n=1 Tax=Cohnella sp. GCM10012308 TaxID=3317329 RepID=UPI00360DB7C2